MSQRWECTVEDLASATGGKILSRARPMFSRVGTDSRGDLKERLFIPLKGENFEAHDFVESAIKSGASAVLISQWREEWRPHLQTVSFVEVDDTLLGLQALAQFWRRRNKFRVLAITGSNGKTSTKEFTLAMLKPHLAVFASRGSFNNHWGVPLSILEAGPEHTHLILEMGMNHSGEIWRLCQIAEPDVVTVTNVGRAHMGELGSQQAVAEAKEEIYLASPKAVHIFNADNEWTMRMQSRSTSKKVLFSSFNPNVDVSLRAQRMTWEGLDVVGQIAGVPGEAWVAILGRQNIFNFMTASCLCLTAGLQPETIWKSLRELNDVAWGRNQVLKMENGAQILWDGYNANPDSMTALLKNLFEMDAKGRKFLIIGDMLELGEFAEKSHEEIGERAAAVGFEAIWYVGQMATAFRRGLEKGGSPFKNFLQSPSADSELSLQFLNLLRSDDLVAVKASRGIALERTFQEWPLSTPLGPKP